MVTRGNRTREEYNAIMAPYILARYHRRRAEAIKFLGGHCVDCGAEEGLQFDHVDPAEKSFSISRLWSVSYERFLAELKKCQLLCQSCHIEKTRAERKIKGL